MLTHNFLKKYTSFFKKEQKDLKIIHFGQKLSTFKIEVKEDDAVKEICTLK